MIQDRQVLIPLEYAEKHNVMLRDLVEKKNNPQIEELVFDMASRANANVTKVQSMCSRLPKEANPVFRQLTPIQHYLELLEKLQFNMYEPELHQRNHQLPLSLLAKKLRRDF